MTTQDPPHQAPARVVATYRDGEAARRATLGVEELGIESSRVHVDAHSPLSPQAADSKVDSATVERGRHMAAQGIIVGAILGALIGLALGYFFDLLPLVISAALFAVPGAVLGAMFGVYTRLQTNTEITDADAGGTVVLTLDLTALDDAERRAAVAKLRAEQPIRLVEA